MPSQSKGQANAATSTITVRQDEVDPLSPTKITHSVNEIVDDGKLIERYNFLSYEFEQNGVYAQARVYLDTIEEVSLYGPSASKSGFPEVSSPAFEAAVMKYLQRRFGQIDKLRPDEGTGRPYVTVWRAPGYKPID